MIRGLLCRVHISLQLMWNKLYYIGLRISWTLHKQLLRLSVTSVQLLAFTTGYSSVHWDQFLCSIELPLYFSLNMNRANSEQFSEKFQLLITEFQIADEWWPFQSISNQSTCRNVSLLLNWPDSLRASYATGLLD